MNAGEVISQFIESSRRYDMVTIVDDEQTPTAQAWYLLNAAQRWLDREMGHPKETAWILKELAAGSRLITFNQCRYVQDVFHETTRLTWIPAYHEIVFDEEDDGAHWPLKAIEVDASTSDRIIRIKAVWYSPTLTDAEQLSFWSVQHPELLVRAMQMQAEIDMRNSQGVRDFAEPLLHDVRQVYFDMVAEEMSGPTEYWRMD